MLFTVSDSRHSSKHHHIWLCYESSCYQGSVEACFVMNQLLLTYYISGPPAAPRTPTVTFPISGQQFTITWDVPPLNMGGTVDTYLVNISGPDDFCGNVNILQRFGVSTRNYTCSGWTMLPAVQTYTFTVQAASCGGDLRGLESDPVTVSLQGRLVEMGGCLCINMGFLVIV